MSVMSIFDQDETLCSRENNNCKRRMKCLRYMKCQGSDDWIADYWLNFGKFCANFVPVPKEKIVAKAGTKSEAD